MESNNPGPEISMFDIEDYVRSLQPGAVVGIPQSRWDCLVANTLKRKYQGRNCYIVGNNLYGVFGNQIVRFNDDVLETARKFDDIWTEEDGENESGDNVTLEVLREKMPELFVEVQA